MTPAEVSECPARYFVALCQTRSTPSAIGRWLTGSRERVVRQRHDAALARDRGHRCDVGDLEPRVARRLDQEQPRGRRDGVRPGPDVRLLGEGAFDPEAWQQRLHEAQRTPVHAPLRHHVVASLHEREHRGGECAHARAEDEAALSAFERRDDVGQFDVVRVPVARVEVWRRDLDRHAGEVGARRARERRRLEDRRGERASGRCRTLAVNGRRYRRAPMLGHATSLHVQPVVRECMRAIREYAQRSCASTAQFAQ